ITDLARRRELTHTIKAAAGIVANHPGDHTQVLADIREKFNQLDSGADESAGTLTWAQLLDEFETAQAPTATPEGITSPWPDLDAFTGGLFGGRMYTIGGAPGDGKSTVALNLAIHAARAGKSVLVFSKEMPTVDVTGRLVAGGAEIDLRVINARNLDDDDRARFRQFRARTRHLKLRVNADQVSMTQIKQIARGVHHRTGLDLLVVDYLQLMTGNERGRSAEEEIANISTGLKQLAMELDVAVVVPAQLNRNHTSRPDQRPTKADLRGSGRIEQDSDVVILLWRPLVDGQPDRYQVVFIIDKNRHGPKGEIKLRWNGGYGVIS
ncbi:DnaB-like helicase C-terminal domain-containing protein, partial [Pseudonocardia autotrophica]